MVTLIKYGALSGGEKYNVNQMYIDGLSTDAKPTTTIDGMGIPNGSVFTEVDTGKTYMFDEIGKNWYEVSIGGGGGTSGGIKLVGETTTPLTDGATTNPITVDGQSYTAQPNDAVIYGNKEFLFDGTNWHEFGDLSGLSSNDIGAMTGYAKASSAAAISTSDTLNQAVGKLEKALDGKQATIDANNKLSSDLVDDTDKTHKFATQAQLDQIGTNKNNISLIKHADNTSIYIQETTPTGAIGDYWISSTNGVKVYGRSDNLLDYSTATLGYYINSSGEPTASSSLSDAEKLNYSDFIAITAENYTLSGNKPNNLQTSVSFVWYDENYDFMDRTTQLLTGGYTDYTFTAQPISEAVYMRVNFVTADKKIMLNEGSTAEPYIGYYDWT